MSAALCLGWFIDVLLLSSILALFEIAFERDRGWASALSQAGWGRHIWEGRLLAQLIEKPYVTPYHLAMFAGFAPFFLFGQLLLVRHIWVSESVWSGPFHLFVVWQIGNTRFSPFFLWLAAWLAIATVEDFLWFAWNWYYPNSLRDLFSGAIWWHTKWITIGKTKVPRFYISSVLITAVLFCLSAYIAIL